MCRAVGARLCVTRPVIVEKLGVAWERYLVTRRRMLENQLVFHNGGG